MPDRIEIVGQLDTTGLTIEAEDVNATGDGVPKRVVTGWAVPWDKVGVTSVGPTKFLKGSLNPELVPAVNRDHNRERLVGKVSHAQDSPMGLHVKARISATDLGNETLTLAGDGIIDGFSVEVVPTKYEFEADDQYGEVMVVSEGEWVGLALTPRPAFGQARVTHVAASADERKGPIVAEEMTAVATALADVAAEMKADRASAIAAAQVQTDRATAEAKARHEAKVTELAADAKEAGIDVSLLHAGKLDEAKDWEIDAAFRKLDKIRPVQVLTTPATPKKPVFAGHPMTALGRFAHATVKAAKGDPTSLAMIRAAWIEAREIYAAGTAEWTGEVDKDPQIMAALNDVGTSDALGLVPPQYTSRIIIPGMVMTPALDNCCIREPLPNVGMSIIKPHLTADVNGAYTSTELAQPATNDVTWGTDTIAVLMYQHAIRVSYALLERSDFGGYAANYFARVVNNHQSAKEQKLVDTMSIEAQETALSGATVLANVARLVTTVVNNQADSETSFGGMRPDYVAMAPDQWELFVTTALTAGGAFTQGAVPVISDDFTATWGGLKLVMVPGMDATGLIVGSSAATRVSEGQTSRYSVLIVSVAAVELGYQAYDAFDVELPLALASNFAASR